MLLLRALAIVASPLVALANPNTISDQRVQDPSLTPALGRGYSLQTYDVLSTCLNFQEKTEPTYNYKYDYHEIDSTGDMSSETKSAISGSLAYSFVRATISGSITNNIKSNKVSKYMVTTMAMERYYSSIDDTTAELTSHAMSIVKRGDLVGFFASCGSGYIRSIRRTAEITAIFEYTSSSENQVKTLAASMETSLFGLKKFKGPTTSFDRKTDNTQTNTDTKITIRAYGLGLNMDGADSLVATSLEGYQAAVQFAFKSMQNDDVGIIKGIEVVPWTSNLQFNDAVVFESTEAIAFDASGNQSIAKGGQPNPHTGNYDVEAKFDDQTNTWVPDDTKKDDSKNKVITGIEVKSITTINAEFITSMERKYGNELHTLTLARQCVGMLKTYKANTLFKDKILIDHSSPSFAQPKTADDCPGGSATKLFSVSQVAGWLNDDQLKDRGQQTQDFITNYYGPCASAIERYSHQGRMTKFWWEIKGCMLGDACTDDGQIKKVSFDADSGVRSTECVPGTTIVDEAQATGAANFDQLVDKYCLPQFDEVASDLCKSFPSSAS